MRSRLKTRDAIWTAVSAAVSSLAFMAGGEAATPDCFVEATKLAIAMPLF